MEAVGHLAAAWGDYCAARAQVSCLEAAALRAGDAAGGEAQQQLLAAAECSAQLVQAQAGVDDAAVLLPPLFDAAEASLASAGALRRQVALRQAEERVLLVLRLQDQLSGSVGALEQQLLAATALGARVQDVRAAEVWGTRHNLLSLVSCHPVVTWM